MIFLNILKKFGKRIANLRKELGISQEKFALKIGIDRTYYSSIENGKHSVSLEKVDQIAKGLNVSLEELFRGIN
ncbi:MAG TPA: helix-turn-helix transcriptional regulator [Bacteroidales bacterium]|nr:helix-turn-helix transcriptional regulator [Bacteroidales bacterium]